MDLPWIILLSVKVILFTLYIQQDKDEDEIQTESNFVPLTGQLR